MRRNVIRRVDGGRSGPAIRIGRRQKRAGRVGLQSTAVHRRKVAARFWGWRHVADEDNRQHHAEPNAIVAVQLSQPPRNELYPLQGSRQVYESAVTTTVARGDYAINTGVRYDATANTTDTLGCVVANAIFPSSSGRAANLLGGLKIGLAAFRFSGAWCEMQM